MNQILITEKIIVTPEFRKKKKIYKLNFFLSIFLACTLFSCYIYAEYDRNKSEQVSQEILSELQTTQAVANKNDNTTISVDNDVLVVALSTDEEGNNEQQGTIVNVDEILRESANNNNDGTNGKQNTIVKSVASDGKEYYTESILRIDSLGIEYPVLSDTSDELLKISLNRLWGPAPNEVGNYVIVGHNYKSGKMFGKLSEMSLGDTFTLEDNSGRTLTYQVYDKYVVEPSDTSCTSQLTNGKKEVTLITCKNSGKQRLIIKAVEI